MCFIKINKLLLKLFFKVIVNIGCFGRLTFVETVFGLASLVSLFVVEV